MICKHEKQGWSLFRHFVLTFLLVGFSYGASLTHCTRLHFTNYRITDVTSALMREDIVRLSIIFNMFKIIVKQFWKASNSNIHFLQNNDDNIYQKQKKQISYNALPRPNARHFSMRNVHAKLCRRSFSIWRTWYRFGSLFNDLVWKPENQ